MSRFALGQYRMVRAAPAIYRTAKSTADSLDLSAAVNTVKQMGPAPGRANPTIAVSCRFATAGATVDVTVIRYHSEDGGTTNTLMGVDTLTATADAYRDAAAGLYLADDLLFDSGACSHYEVRCKATSAGNVTVHVWSFGGSSE